MKALTKAEIELLRHALYCHREQLRLQERLALHTPTDAAKRDAERFGRLIRDSLTLDGKLSDMRQMALGGAPG